MNRLLAVLAALALVVVACGGGDDVGAAATTGTEAPATTDASPTSQAPTTTLAATTTEAPTTTTTTATPGGIVAREDPEVDAVVQAYSIAFDSVSGYEEKALYIDDPSGLEETVAAYLETGETFGGVTVNATSVTISGDTAEVGYDLLFNGNPSYPDLTGTAILTPDGWKVPRDVFCWLMNAARVGCPDP